MSTFVMIAGAGLGGWAWRKVRRILEDKGHEVHTPSLTGEGDRVHLLSASTDLETHVADVVNLIEFDDLTAVILVGHSYGGVVATGVADQVRSRVQKLVYVDAPMGLSHREIFPDVSNPEMFPRRKIDGVELMVFPSEDLIAFYGITDPAEIAWTLQRLTPHPARASVSRLQVRNKIDLASVPRYHIVASQTVAIGAHDGLPAAERSAGKYFELDGPHALMSVIPEELSEVLVSISASV